MEIPYHNKIKNVTFDAFWKFPWDFKTHATNNGRYVIVNACSAIDQAISEFDYFGVVIVKGTAKYDNEEHTGILPICNVTEDYSIILQNIYGLIICGLIVNITVICYSLIH